MGNDCRPASLSPCSRSPRSPSHKGSREQGDRCARQHVLAHRERRACACPLGAKIAARWKGCQGVVQPNMLSGENESIEVPVLYLDGERSLVR
jgi:hypothetical protein